MIRSVEFDLETWSPNAERFSSEKGRHGRDNKIRAQRKAVRETLNRAFGAVVPMPNVLAGNVMQPNRIRVRFTRIAAGTLDAEENLPMSFKHVKDEIAEWCGFANDRHPIFAWGPYEQEKAPPRVLRVRLVIEDLTPGERAPVVLAATAHIAREDTARVKKRVAEELKRRGAVQVYRPEEGARAASSGARARAEASFAKLTGKSPSTVREALGVSMGAALTTAMAADARPTANSLSGWSDMIVKPTATDLRDAAERLGLAPGAERAPERQESLQSKGSILGQNRRRDPGEEARPETLADCGTCRAKIPARCTRVGDERMVYGVHVSRARAAGLTVPADDRATVRPARTVAPRCAATNEVAGARSVNRRVATVPGQARLVARQAFVAYPWRQPVCDACEGRGALIGVERDKLATRCGPCEGRGHRVRELTREPLLEDVRIVRPVATFNVPLAHRARWGDQVTLYRRERDLPGRGRCWVYDAAKPQEGP